jgi:hypothetical protein
VIDYDGYCNNARIYTQRYAIGSRPEKVDLFFSNDAPLIRSETTLLNSDDSAPRPNSNSDSASLQNSLRAIYDSEMDFMKNRVNSATSWYAMPPNVVNINPLYFDINWNVVVSRWNSISSNCNEGHEFNSCFASSGAHLFALARGQITSPTKHPDEISDLKICFALLEKATLYLQGKGRRLGLPLDEFYDTVDTICRECLVNWLGKKRR